MSAQAETSILGKPVERVGVIVVHGIGEQGRYEHLESETRKIVDAIIDIYGQRRRDVTVTLSTGTDDAFHGTQSSWVSGSEAPLHALVELKRHVVDVAFHEVWWADVNEALTLGKQVRFWLWGLSLPGIATRNKRVLPGALQQTRRPDHADELTWWHRIRMGYVSVLFGLSAFSIAFINMILKRLEICSPFFHGRNCQLPLRSQALQPRQASRWQPNGWARRAAEGRDSSPHDPYHGRCGYRGISPMVHPSA